ncbi:MAG: hypothetical protein DRQ40_06460 [Gammaproteobacteria bacterium]|nr:MAG: hypothetical protein DRQ40_06460 [Gammaproteobacteria bacterium]
MTIKKAFVAINAILLANEDKKVKTIMPDLVELMSAKGAGGGASSVHRNEAGEVVGIMDYYFKVWLPVAFVEYGAKANSASGLNTMCKLGTSLWTKQQREFKKGKEELLDNVAAGDVLPTEIQQHLDDLEEARGFIAAYPIPELAFASTEDMDAATDEDMEAAVQAYQDALDEAEAERIAAEAAEEE